MAGAELHGAVLPPPGPFVALLSGVPLVLLGAGLLGLLPRRGEQIFFAAFAVAWGIQVAAANVGVALNDATLFWAGHRLSIALLPVMALLLAHFAVRAAGVPGTTAFTGAVGALAAAAVVVLLWRPEWSLGSVETTHDGGLGLVRLGPGHFWLHNLPLFVAFYGAIVLLYLRYRSSESGSPRHRIRGMLLALLLYTSAATVGNLVTSIQLSFGDVTFLRGDGRLYVVLFAAGTGLICAMFLHAVARPLEHERRDVWLLIAFAAPAVLAAGNALLGVDTISALSFGLWRIAAVAVLVHAIARYRLFDLRARLADHTPALAAILASALAVTASAVLLAAREPVAALWVLVGGVLVLAAALTSRRTLARRLMARHSADPDTLAQRRRDVYRASLSAALTAGRDASTDALVRELRRTLRVTEREHRRLLLTLDRPASAPDRRLPESSGPAPWADRFVIDRPLRSGRIGRTFRALDLDTQDHVALKVVREDAIGGAAARLMRAEIDALAAIEHPRVVRMVAAGEYQGCLWLATEWVEGGDLDGLLRRSGRIPVIDALRIADDLLDALAAVHARGIVHGDMKPHNVLLDQGGRAKLADFGLARGDAGHDRSSTLVGAGTLLFMSPEQVRGQRGDARSDLYSVAVVLHRMVAGAFYIPLAGKDDFQIRQAILEQPPALARIDDAALRDALARGLAKDPKARWQSAAEMRAALASVGPAGSGAGRPARAGHSPSADRTRG